jgi:hypothetical protein
VASPTGLAIGLRPIAQPSKARPRTRVGFAQTREIQQLRILIPCPAVVP